MSHPDVISRTFIGTAALTGKVGYAVAQDGAVTIQPWDNAAQVPLGILYHIDEGDSTVGSVALPGSIVKAIAGETLAPGTDFFLTTDGNGKLKAAAAGEYYVALLAGRFGGDEDDEIQVQVAIGQLDSDT